MLSEPAVTDIMGPRLSAALALRPKHLVRPGYFVAWWLRRRRRLLHDHGLLLTRSSTRPAEGGELVRGPQQVASAVLSNGGSSSPIAVTYEGPSGVVYPSPISSAPTSFTLLAGSSNQFVTVGSSMLPVAGFRFTLNVPSSAGARVNFIAVQADVG
jgi:hypothetical protein